MNESEILINPSDIPVCGVVIRTFRMSASFGGWVAETLLPKALLSDGSPVHVMAYGFDTEIAAQRWAKGFVPFCYGAQPQLEDGTE